MGAPFRRAPAPRSAVKSSRLKGSTTTPAIISLFFARPKGDIPDGIAVGEAGGAIEGVNIPAERGFEFDAAAFFGDDAVVGKASRSRFTMRVSLVQSAAVTRS
jgi:hypothetical protein